MAQMAVSVEQLVAKLPENNFRMRCIFCCIGESRVFAEFEGMPFHTKFNQHGRLDTS